MENENLLKGAKAYIAWKNHGLPSMNLNVKPVKNAYFLNPELAGFINNVCLSFEANRDYALEEMISALQHRRIFKIKDMIRKYHSAVTTLHYIEKETFAVRFQENRAIYNKVRKLFCYTKEGKENTKLSELGIEIGAYLNYQYLPELLDFFDAREQFGIFLRPIKGICLRLFQASVVLWVLIGLITDFDGWTRILGIIPLLTFVSAVLLLIYYIINKNFDGNTYQIEQLFLNTRFDDINVLSMKGRLFDSDYSDNIRKVKSMNLGLRYLKAPWCTFMPMKNLKGEFKGYIFDEFVENLDEGNFIEDYSRFGVKNGRLDEFPEGYRTDLEALSEYIERRLKAYEDMDRDRSEELEKKKQKEQEKKQKNRDSLLWTEYSEIPSQTVDDESDRQVRRRKS